jgi:3-deoxy-D-manno-octulosonic-acid transferase
MINSILYNLMFIPAFVLYLPFFVKRLIQRGVGTTDFGERFGLFSREKKEMLASYKKPIMIHAVSVGEVIAALNFMKSWQERDSSVQFVLSVTTTTGHAMALKKLLPRTTLIYSPLDFLWSVQSTLNHVNPAMVVIFEVEIWPNLIRQTKKSGAVLALVNCRMSDSSSKGYARFKWFFKPLFDAFDLICAQSNTDIQRLAAITGSRKRTLLCNTMKFDQQAPVLSEGGGRKQFVDEVFADRSLIFSAASTHAGEEEMILEVFKELQKKHPGLKLILTPRHSERSPEVEKIIQNQGISYTKLEGNHQQKKVDVLLVNTTGELINFLAVSDIVFVGKSMCGNHGGHNIIEPALLGKAVIHGTNMENFQYVVDAFQEEEASLMVGNKQELTEKLSKLLADDLYREKIAAKAIGVVEKYRGAIDKTIDSLQQIQSSEYNL